MYVGKMFAVCFRYASNRQEAEEIVQEGFVQVFRSLKNFKNTGSFEGWIKRIMVNCAIQHFRTKSKLHPVIDIDTTSVEEIGNEDIISHLGKKRIIEIDKFFTTCLQNCF